MLKKSILFFLVLGLLTSLSGQTRKYEFRGVWVSSVANIDWPSKPGLSSDVQQSEIIKILDHHKKNNVNAIILQIRPTADALYKSDYEPWSKYLTGEQGVSPVPLYDPLKFWIKESHKRGMELHAWFNPYRIKQNANDSLAEMHIYNKKPEFGWEYGNRAYFEPGHPAVWDWVTKVVVDVVSRYDIDAVHFDDYFYPYKIKDAAFPDSNAFKKYGGQFYPDNIEDWRRHNVDTVIQLLSSAIKETKPWVKFGISPFGIWRNRKEDPLGSETNGYTNYDGLYADVIKWQKLGWIDYLMPQLYWRDDHPVADFSTLAYWWNDFNYGRSMYIGLAPYRINRKSDHKLWKRDKHLLRQIEVLRTLSGIDGFGFFSSKHFFRNDLKRFDRRIERKYMEKPAIVPPMPWIDNTAPAAPINVKIENSSLVWEVEPDTVALNIPRFFVVYYYKKANARYLKEPGNVLEITGEKKIDFDGRPEKGIYRVSALDRLNNESQLSNILLVE